MLEHFTDLDGELAVGSHPHAPEHVEFLAAAGVRAVVCLQSDEDLRGRGIRWPIMWQLHMRLGLAVTRVPIRDFDRADLLARLDEAVAAVAGYVQAGRKVFVHCNAGMNRSPSVVIAYLVAHRGWSLAEALEWVTERHSSVPYPDVLQAWLGSQDDR